MLLKIASSQAARDEVILRDLERGLSELEKQYQMTAMEGLNQSQSAIPGAGNAQISDLSVQEGPDVRTRPAAHPL